MTKIEQCTEKNNGILTVVFETAKQGAFDFNFPISNAGRFELIMYDIWLGIRIIESKGLFIDYDLISKRREEFLKEVIRKLGLPLEKKYERLYIFRDEGWKHDTLGLMHSDYPRTKQFIPAYIYFCVVACPMMVYGEEKIMEEIEKIPFYKIIDFLVPFCDHYSWMVETIINRLDNEFILF